MPGRTTKILSILYAHYVLACTSTFCMRLLLVAPSPADRGRFDAIVTDVRMPRVDGVQLANQLHSSGPYTPVIIFVSGYLDLTFPDAYDIGVEAILSKPCEKKELISAVEKSLQRRNLNFAPCVASLLPVIPKVVRNLSSTVPAQRQAIRPTRHSKLLRTPDCPHIAVIPNAVRNLSPTVPTGPMSRSPQVFSAITRTYALASASRRASAYSRKAWFAPAITCNASANAVKSFPLTTKYNSSSASPV